MNTRFDFPRYTYDDYKNWKEDWELIDGYPMQFLPSATAAHNRTQLKFVRQLDQSLQKLHSNCSCSLFFELDWKINQETVVRPDIMIVCGKVSSDFLEMPPVLIVEIVSPTSIKKDRNIKFELYRENGVKYYILADYSKTTIEIFQLIDNLYKQVNISAFEIGKNCQIDLDFNNIWN